MGLNFGQSSLFGSSKERGEGFGSGEHDPNTCRVYSIGADQNLPAATNTKVIYTDATNDESKMSDGTGNITIKVSGYYIIQTVSYIDMVNTDVYQITIQVNANSKSKMVYDNNHANESNTLNCQSIEYLEEGDVVTCLIYNWGGSASTLNNNEDRTYMQVHRLATGGI